MTKPILEVVENDLKHTNEDLLILKKEIEDLKEWKANCTKWAIWWAGVCAAVMTMATFVQTYWTKIQQFMVGK